MSIKLSDTQLAMMQAASHRDDRCVALSPRLKGGAAQKVAAKLITAGLAREIKARDDMPTWRRDADQAFALKLTAAGIRLVASDGDCAADGKDERADSSEAKIEQPRAAGRGIEARPPRDSAPRDGSKLAEVVAMLQRDEGVTIGDLMSATGWLPHTARAAMTGLRKRGYSVIRERVEAGGSAYRISMPAEGKGASDAPDIAAAPDRRKPKVRLAA
jgi:Protein of unknown function (DUF3489)